MVSEALAPSGQMGFEELAWTLFEFTAADQMFVYRASETSKTLDPVLALGSLSLAEKQGFWASQLDLAIDPLGVRLAGYPADFTLMDDWALSGNFVGSVVTELRAASWLVFPLANRDGLLAVTLVGWFDPTPRLPDDRRKLARIIARSMALETDNARLYEQTHQQRRQAQLAQETTQAILRRELLADTLTLISREVMRSADALGCAIRLFDDQGHPVLAAQVGETASSPLTADNPVDFRMGQQPFVIPVLAEPFSEIERGLLVLAPLVSGQTTIGYLELTQVEAYHQPRDRAAARAFADQAAVAVELDRMYQRLQRTAVEEERARLARDLHDSISQSIYAMTLYTRAARRKLEEGDLLAVEKHLGELHSSAREVLGEMRLLIYELRPMALEQYGLKGILEQRLQSVEARSGLEADLDFDLPGALPPRLEENLYHIILEALNNTIKHAGANRVWVSIRKEAGDAGVPDTVRLVIRDDGAGFDPAEVPQGGLGLKSIRDRVEMLHGRLVVDSQPGAGVILSVEVPYGENPNPDR